MNSNIVFELTANTDYSTKANKEICLIAQEMQEVI